MRDWFDKLTEATAIATNEIGLQQALTRLTQNLGFDCFAYLDLDGGRAYAISSYPVQWQQFYLERGYAADDPVVTTAKRIMRAFIWSASELAPSTDRKTARFFSEAASFGIRSGVSIPVRGAYGHIAMLTLASNAPSLKQQPVIDPVLAAAAVGHLHGSLQRLQPEPITKQVFKPEELACLKWSAAGKNFRDIAVLEGMKYSSVCFHIRNAQRKLDVWTLPHATASATRLKLI